MKILRKIIFQKETNGRRLLIDTIHTLLELVASNSSRDMGYGVGYIHSENADHKTLHSYLFIYSSRELTAG